MNALKPLWILLQALLVMSTFALATNAYINDGAGFGYVLPDYFYYFVIFGIAGISALWALVHIVGGGLFGMAAGGVLDGMKLGLVLGVGIGISRVWLYVLAWGAGAFAGQAPIWHVVGFGVLGALLYALNRFVMYFWNNIHN